MRSIWVVGTTPVTSPDSDLVLFDTVASALAALSQSAPDILLLADTARPGGNFNRIDLVTGTLGAGARVVVLRGWDGDQYLGGLTPPSKSGVGEVTYLDYSCSDLEIDTHLGATLRWMQSERHAVPTFSTTARSRAYKRGEVVILPGGVCYAGWFSPFPVNAEASSYCEDHTDHPRGIPDPEIDCYEGFSAFFDLERAHAYGELTAPIFEVELRENLAQTGSRRGTGQLLGGRQQVLRVLHSPLCQKCLDESKWGTGKELVFESVEKAGLTVLRPSCLSHATSQALTLREVNLLDGRVVHYWAH